MEVLDQLVDQACERRRHLGVLRDFGLLENEHVDNFLTSAFSKSEAAAVLT